MPSGSHEQRQEAAELERRRLSRLGALERKFVEGEFDHDEDDDEDWDDEEDGEGHSPQQEVPPPPPGTLTYRRFGQEVGKHGKFAKFACLFRISLWSVKRTVPQHFGL